MSAVAWAGAARPLPLREAPPLNPLVYETPVPGTPTVPRTPARLFAETRAPRAPALMPTLRGETEGLTPGANLERLADPESHNDSLSPQGRGIALRAPMGDPVRVASDLRPMMTTTTPSAADHPE